MSGGTLMVWVRVCNASIGVPAAMRPITGTETGRLPSSSETPLPERVANHEHRLVERQRLLDEIERAQTRGLDRSLDRAVTGHHDNGAAVGEPGRPLAQQRDAIDVRHPDVEQHEVGDLTRARGACLCSVGRYIHLVALLGEDLLQQAADVRLVVDHENVWTAHALSLRN